MGTANTVDVVGSSGSVEWILTCFFHSLEKQVRGAIVSNECDVCGTDFRVERGAIHRPQNANSSEVSQVDANVHTDIVTGNGCSILFVRFFTEEKADFVSFIKYLTIITTLRHKKHWQRKHRGNILPSYKIIR